MRCARGGGERRRVVRHYHPLDLRTHLDHKSGEALGEIVGIGKRVEGRRRRRLSRRIRCEGCHLCMVIGAKSSLVEGRLDAPCKQSGDGPTPDPSSVVRRPPRRPPASQRAQAKSRQTTMALDTLWHEPPKQGRIETNVSGRWGEKIEKKPSKATRSSSSAGHPRPWQQGD